MEDVISEADESLTSEDELGVLSDDGCLKLQVSKCIYVALLFKQRWSDKNLSGPVTHLVSHSFINQTTHKTIQWNHRCSSLESDM